MKKYATGIESFDLNIGGGFPQGSVILLLGDVGAGNSEFLYTSISKTNIARKFTKEKDIVFPDKIHYLSFSKSKEDILQEVQYSFTEEHFNSIQNSLNFHDFSDLYFNKTIIHLTKLSFAMKKERIEDNEIKILANFFDENAKDNVIIIDSLTDLLTSPHLHFNDILAFLKVVQRMAKNWGGIIYFLLTKDILEKNKEELIADVVDGVIVFSWSGLGSTKRRRDVYIKKFRGLMPRMEQEKIAKLEVKITPKTGFEVANVRMIA